MKKTMKHLLTVATVCAVSFAATACKNSDDDGKENDTLPTQQLVGLWVTDYAENGTEGDVSWTRVVEDYLLRDDGTCCYERYALNGQTFVRAESVRGREAFHYFTAGKNLVHIVEDKTSAGRALVYANGKITDPEGHVFLKATAEQQALVDQLYVDWQGANSAGDDDDNKRNDVNDNIDVNTAKRVQTYMSNISQ